MFDGDGRQIMSLKEGSPSGASTGSDDVPKDVADIMADLIARFDGRLRRYLRRFLNEPDAEDALQDIYARLIKLSRQIPPPDFNAVYVFKAADSVVRDRHRRHVSRSGDQHVEISETLPQDGPSPFEALRWRQNADLLRRAISTLNRDERMVLMLHRVEGLKLTEISEKQRIPLRTVQRLLADALAKCRHKLKDSGWFEL
jgi:RNA polymerase sigma factor (sigma-70 family)